MQNSLEVIASFDSLDSADPYSLTAEARGDLIDAAGGSTPPGGWTNLINLCVGAGAIKATHTEYLIDAEKVKVLSRQDLVDGFTRRFVPPTVHAIGMICLGISPLTGLGCAWVRGSSKTTYPGFKEMEVDLQEMADRLSTVYTKTAESASRSGCTTVGALGSTFAVFADHAGFEPNHMRKEFAKALLDLVLVPAGIMKQVDNTETYVSL